MYLYKVYLHCQECLGTERQQRLAARSPRAGRTYHGCQAASWKVAGLARLAGGRGQPAAGQTRGGLAGSQDAHFPQKDACYHNFFSKLLEKLQSNIATFQVITWWQGSFLNPTHLHMSVTPMPTTFAAHEGNFMWFSGEKSKVRTPHYREIHYRKTWAKTNFPMCRAWFWLDLESVANHVYMQNENQKKIFNLLPSLSLRSDASLTSLK